MTTGFGGVTNLGFYAKHFGFFTHADHFGRDFNINDLGFLRTRRDRTAVNGGIEVMQPDPWRIFRNAGAFVGSGQAWNGDGLVFERFVNVGARARFQNFWSVNLNTAYAPEVLNDLDTRGGPPIVQPAGHWLGTFLSTDSRKSWQYNTFGGIEWNAGGSYGRFVEADLRLRPSASVQTTVAASYSRTHSTAQWVANLDATGDGEVDHVYGTLESHVVDFTLRGTFALHPDLTVEGLLRPFIAVGSYVDFRRLARPSSFEFEPVALPFNPDFNRKSLRGNLVLRWEYRPGSTLFAVWNVLGADLSRPGLFDFTRDLGGTFASDMDHVLMLKGTYWLSW